MSKYARRMKTMENTANIIKGLFTWVELPGIIKISELLVEFTANPDIKVAFVAGEGFFVEGNGRGSNCKRLSFGANTPDKIRIGIERLVNLIKSKLV